MIGYIIALAVAALYVAALLLGRRLGLWKRIGASLYGPVLMLKTARGRGFIDRLASHARIWRRFATASVIVCLASMFIVTAFVAWQVLGVLDLTEPVTTDDLGHGLPEVNTLAILAYLVIGLSVATVVHEFTHGVLSRTGGLKLDSMGVLFLVIPIGAFVEPNEKELKAADKRTRMRLYSGGPAANMFAALLFLALLLGPIGQSIEPVSEGAIVTGIAPDSPADTFGIEAWSEIVAVDGHAVAGAGELNDLSFAYPGDAVVVEYLYNGQRVSEAVPGGVAITSVLSGPAFDAGLKTGMIIRSLNWTVIHNVSHLTSVIENATSQEPVEISVLKYAHDWTNGRMWFVREWNVTSINLTSKWLYYRVHFPDLNREEYRNVSFMGVSAAPFGVKVEDADYLTSQVVEPFSDLDERGGFVSATVRFLGLPMLGFSPAGPPATDLYAPTGILGWLPNDAYWMLANLLYWLFWTNILVGLANALPALPLDGGYVLGDGLKRASSWAMDRMTGLDRAIGRRTASESEIDMLMVAVSVIVGLAVLVIAAWPLLD